MKVFVRLADSEWRRFAARALAQATAEQIAGTRDDAELLILTQVHVQFLFAFPRETVRA
jgi:hypothetical protein